VEHFFKTSHGGLGACTINIFTPIIVAVS
jgi:hypothetical protein